MFLCHWSQAHETAIADFSSYLRILNRSKRTIDAYDGVVREFLKRTTKPIEDLDGEDVFDYLVYLKDERGLAAQTVNQRRAALVIFFREILDIRLPRKVLKYAKRPASIPDPLTLSESTAFLRATKDLKLRTLFMIMYSAGLRLTEATHLRPADIDSERMIIHVRQGKGMKDRNVMLSPRMLEGLRDYWQQYRPKGWLFPGRGQAPLSSRIVQRACKEAALRAGIRKKVTPHILRHSFAAQLMRNGANLRHLQALLGHNSLRTTMVYLKVVPESLDVTSPLDMLDI